MRNYAYYSLNPVSKITIEYMVDTIAFTTENFVFAYLGISIPLIYDYINFTHMGMGLLALVIARPFGIYIVSFFINKCKKKSIPVSHQTALIYTGLRGAVAFYMVLSMTFLKEVSFVINSSFYMHRSGNQTQ